MKDRKTEQNAPRFFQAQAKPMVFVLMPFAPEFDDVYQLGIKAAVQEAGGYAERLDEQIFTESMLERVYSQIEKADVIIADMTDRNPNVFYEVGYAHAVNKVVLLLTRVVEDIPFDLRHFQHIIYDNGIAHLKKQLIPSVNWALGEAHRREIEVDLKGGIAVSHGEEMLSSDGSMKNHPSIHLVRPRNQSWMSIRMLAENTSGTDSSPVSNMFIFSSEGAPVTPARMAARKIRHKSLGGLPADISSEEEVEQYYSHPLIPAQVRRDLAPGGLVNCYRLEKTLDSIPPEGIETIELVFAQNHESISNTALYCLRVQSLQVVQDFFFKIAFHKLKPQKQ